MRNSSAGKSWASESGFADVTLEGVFFLPLSEYRGRSEATFRPEEEEVFFRGMVSSKEVGEGGWGASPECVIC